MSDRLRLAVWSPLPPSPSGIADYVAEQLPHLARHADLTVVVPDPEAVLPRPGGVALASPESAPADADLHVYHLGNSPAHAYVYRAALARPGVVVLHDFSLHHLVLSETVERGDRLAYLTEIRRAHGEEGTFVGRQVARALGGDLLPALFPLNERVVEGALGLVTLTRSSAARLRLRLPGRPLLHLPHHATLPLDPVPSRAEARQALGLPPAALVVTAPGLATANKRLDLAIRTIGALRAQGRDVRLVVAGGVDRDLPLADWIAAARAEDAVTVAGRLSLDDFVRHLAAADVVMALRFPSHGEISGALLRSLAVGRPALVTGGTPAAEEFPEGVVVPIDPGATEEAHLRAVLERLLGDAPLRESIGALARDHVRAHHDLARTVEALASFLRDLAGRKDALSAQIALRRPAQGTTLAMLLDEVRWAALDLGLAGVELGVEPMLAELCPPAPDAKRDR